MYKLPPLLFEIFCYRRSYSCPVTIGIGHVNCRRFVTVSKPCALPLVFLSHLLLIYGSQSGRLCIALALSCNQGFASLMEIKVLYM